MSYRIRRILTAGATIGRANLNSINLDILLEILDLLLLLVSRLHPSDCSVVEVSAEHLHLELLDWIKELHERRGSSIGFHELSANLLKLL